MGESISKFAIIGIMAYAEFDGNEGDNAQQEVEPHVVDHCINGRKKCLCHFPNQLPSEKNSMLRVPFSSRCWPSISTSVMPRKISDEAGPSAPPIMLVNTPTVSRSQSQLSA